MEEEDLEVAAMRKAFEALAPLEEEARARVLWWLARRFAKQAEPDAGG